MPPDLCVKSLCTNIHFECIFYFMTFSMFRLVGFILKLLATSLKLLFSANYLVQDRIKTVKNNVKRKNKL